MGRKEARDGQQQEETNQKAWDIAYRQESTAHPEREERQSARRG
jgi:hypothetical protein